MQFLPWLAALMLLGPHPAHGDDTTPTETTASNTAVSCAVAGITWTDGFKYLTGDSNVFPSVYAKCDNGMATCFNQTGLRDVASETIACDENHIRNERRRLGIYIHKDFKWPNGVVCYSYGYDFSANERQVFTKAMDEFQQKTPIRFITLDQCKSKYGTSTEVCYGCKYAFTFLQEDKGCYASVGFDTRRKSYINFGPTCFNPPNVHVAAVHELGHILGLKHEHIHPKREVVVLRDKIRVSADQYRINRELEVLPYNRQSVMHYGRNTGLCVPKDRRKRFCDLFEQKGEGGCEIPTETDCDDAQDKTFGRASGLADSDVKTIAKMYGWSK